MECSKGKSMITPIKAPEDQMAIVIGHRQLVAICCTALLVLGLVTTLAYLCGRSITAAQMRPAENLPPQAIVVDPTRQSGPVPSIMGARAESLPIAPPPVTRPVAVPTVPAAIPKPLVAGRAYWQVGMVDRGVATVFVEYLSKLGLTARVVPGDTSTMSRVLVGPLSDGEQTESTRRTLEKAGFQYFLRRY